MQPVDPEVALLQVTALRAIEAGGERKPLREQAFAQVERIQVGAMLPRPAAGPRPTDTCSAVPGSEQLLLSRMGW